MTMTSENSLKRGNNKVRTNNNWLLFSYLEVNRVSYKELLKAKLMSDSSVLVKLKGSVRVLLKLLVSVSD